MFTKTDIEKYFTGEKSESLVFLCLGIAGIVAAVVFFFFCKTNFYKGAAIPSFVIGLLLTIVGYTVYKRSDGDRIRNTYAYDMKPVDLKEKEIPRMEKVMKSFILYRCVEIILAITGIALFVYFKNDDAKTFWKGLGLTLAIMALLALTADYFAEQRGKIYLKGLKEFTAVQH